MAYIISFISRKGGTGKTTNAINISTVLHSLGYKVVLIETDTNYTLSTLRQMELHQSSAKPDSVFKIIGSDDAGVLEDIEVLQKRENPDYFVIDSAGKTTDEYIKQLAIKSDMVIVPTSLSQNDLLVTYQTIEDLRPAQQLNPKLKLVVLPNRLHSRTSVVGIHKQLEDLRVILPEQFVPQKNIYAQFSTIMPEKEYLHITKEIVQYTQS
ncbi:ParA family protein [Eisenibacter elegans]|jgi:chromosome partitioning protein|uniref:ParA family protein n=1 Tax=Eisenibacter elegans TaxID=997 RepID=UPI0003FE4A37|nr:ParA family protein [Eisenibacter elegans]